MALLFPSLAFRFQLRIYFFILASLFKSATVLSEVDVDYNRDIRSILSDKCFECHGPDKANRKADLRLDTEDFITETVAPGRPDLSAVSYTHLTLPTICSV